MVGGLGRHVHALARHLAGLGHEVVVLCRHEAGTDALTHPTADTVAEGVRVVRVAEYPTHLLFEKDLVAWTLAMGHGMIRAGLGLLAITVMFWGLITQGNYDLAVGEDRRVIVDTLVALAFDLTIREQTGNRKSLDDVMRLLWQRFGRDFYRGKPVGVEESQIEAIFAEATGAQLGASGFNAEGVFESRAFPPIRGQFPVRQSTFVAPGAPRRAWIGTKISF